MNVFKMLLNCTLKNDENEKTIMKMVMFYIVYILPQLKKKLKRNSIICAQKTAGNKCP